MNYSEYRQSFKSEEEFIRAYGRLTREEARALAAEENAPVSIKACMMDTWRKAKQHSNMGVIK